MEDILIMTDPSGGTAVLTTDSPQSHYGVPVLRIEAKDVSGDFGPADMVGKMTAADIIVGWASQDKRDDADLIAARKFLAQWPDGPQLWGGPRSGSGRPSMNRKKKTFYVTDAEAVSLAEYLKGIREK